MNPGSTGILGLTGIAQTAIAPEGTVFVRGELWSARTQISIAPGERVRVIGIDGLTLNVQSEKDDANNPNNIGC